MNIAGGIDLGGTKIEAQRFDQNWDISEKRRIDTPKTYPELLSAMAVLITWLKGGDTPLPIGVATAGFVNPTTRVSIAANLPSHGQKFRRDLEAQCNAALTLINDCRAFVQAEARFGSGSQTGCMLGIMLGTGIGGAIAINGCLVNNGHGQSGEFGHLPMPAETVEQHKLPLLRCGCGRKGCYETLASGPGLERLAYHLLGRKITSHRLTLEKQAQPDLEKIWQIWCSVNAQLLHTLILTVDPHIIVLGGGLSNIEGLIPALEKHLARLRWEGLQIPVIKKAARGETAAALGAAYQAWQGTQNV